MKKLITILILIFLCMYLNCYLQSVARIDVDGYDSTNSPFYPNIVGIYDNLHFVFNDDSSTLPYNIGQYFELKENGDYLFWNAKSFNVCNCIKGQWVLDDSILYRQSDSIIILDCNKQNPHPKEGFRAKEFTNKLILHNVTDSSIVIDHKNGNFTTIFKINEEDIIDTRCREIYGYHK